MNNTSMAVTAITATALVLAVLTILMNTPAFAQLQCTPNQNPAGKTPPGQETCTCPPLTQCTENQNPAGKTPPGQNK